MTKYQWLQNELENRYGYYYEKYPYFMMMLDLPLRHYITREGEAIQKNSIDKIKHKYNKNYDLKKLTKFLLFNLYKPFSSIINNNKNKIGVLGGWGKFPLLLNHFNALPEYDVCNLINQNTVGLLRYNIKSIPINYPNQFGFEKICFNLSYNLDEFFNDIKEEIIKNINEKLQCQNEKLSKELNKNKINYILASNDQWFFQQFFLKAANQANIPYYVIAHGYFHKGYYIGALPINADKLLVWDDNMKNSIIGEDERFKNKVITFGYPKYDYKYLKKFEEKEKVNALNNSILLVSQPFEEVGGTYFDRERIYNEISFLAEKNNFSVNVRFHGKERDNQDKIKQAKKYNFNISSESNLLKDILSNEYVLGFNSSVMFEAATIKGYNKVMIVDDYNDSTNLYDKIKKYSIKDIFEYINNDQSNTKLNQENLIYNFEDKIKDIINH